MRRLIFSLFIVFGLFVAAVAAQDDTLNGEILNYLNVRSGPSTDHPVISEFEPGTAVMIEGRNEFGDWLLVSTPDGVTRGWVAIGFVRFEREVRIMEEIPLGAADAVAPPPAPEVEANGEAPSVDAGAPVVALPADPNEITGPALRMGGGVVRNVRSIYERGQANGNNDAMFIKVGDSNIAEGAFFCNFGRGNYDLGPFGQYQSVVDHFNETNSFCYESISAQGGFGTFSALDPTFAPNEICEGGENAVTCEIRRSRPAFAFVYLGVQDLEQIRYFPSITHETYRFNLVQVVRELTDAGVIPILSTFPTSDPFRNDNSDTVINNVIREVAAAERVPLIDLRAVTRTYDNRGTDPDGYHMGTPPGGQTNFNGNQDVYGRTRYELLALEVLYTLRNQLD